MSIITSRATTSATAGTGVISVSTSSATVTGTSTLFLTETLVGKALFTNADVYIGTISTINSNTSITLTANGAVAVPGVSYKIGYQPINTPLTNVQIDTNFINLNNDKVESNDAVSTNTVNKVVRRDSSGNFSAGTITATFSGNLTGNVTGNVTGNADTATSAATFTTSRTINGTSFNGSANITTSTWGNARTLTIGSTGKSVDGTGNVSWSLAEITGTTSTPQFGSLGVGTAASGTTGEIRASNAITSYYSDSRLKENITIIENALEKICQLDGVTYNANQLAESFGFTNKEKQVGVLADQVEKVLPEAVKPAPFDIIRIDEKIEISRSGQNYKTVQYEKLVPLLIQSIKELKEELDMLKGVNNG